MSQLYDVVAVDMQTHKVRVLTTKKTLNHAESYRDMAVIGRGVDKEFFAEVKAGTYHDGDTWKGGAGA